MKKNIALIILFTILSSLLTVSAQELQAKVSIQAQRVSTTVDKRIFTTLQNQLTNLLNSRQWSSDNFQAQEKITCNFLIAITEVPEQDVYRASLTVQAVRPVYNSTYQSTIVNFQDPDFTFKYVEFQPIEFNESRVQGTESLSGNLTATMAYYVYMILGFDYDSFSPKGGAPYFQKAQNIVSNAPEGRNISGWHSFDGMRNRYWLAENFNNPKYNVIHDIIYDYYRKGLDNMYENTGTASKNMFGALTRLQQLNKDNPNTMAVQFLMQGKADEIAAALKNLPADKPKAVQLLTQLDIANADIYKQEIK